MIKMRQEAQNRKRRTMHIMRAPVGGDGSGGSRPGRQSEAPENVFARLARGEMDEEEYLTDEEQLDVLPGFTECLSVHVSVTHITDYHELHPACLLNCVTDCITHPLKVQCG
jgi:hypothetical protein